MERLRGLESYFKEKDRKKLDAKHAETNALGIPTMTEEEIKQSCVENGGYETPELNDKLYLHFRGFKKIENLDKYTGAKAIWLDSNGLASIEGLDCLTELRCLYLSKNLIGSISNLQCLQELIVLDLSSNRLTKLDGLSCLPKLDNLNLNRNALTTVESIAHLKDCKALRTLDIQNNRLENDEGFVELFADMESLCTLSINGNEFTKMQHFRKTMIYKLPKLGFLDRPVEELERLCSEAYMKDGPEAEKDVRSKFKADQAQERHDRMENFRTWQKEQQEIRKNVPAEQRTRMEVEDAEKFAAREAAGSLAAEVERRAIKEVGIPKISMRVAELEAQGQGGSDVVFKAQQQLLAELDDERRVVELDEQGNELPPAPPAVSDLDALDEDDDVLVPPMPPAGRTKEPLSGCLPGFEGMAGGKLSAPVHSIATSADEGRTQPEYSQHALKEEEDQEEAAVVESADEKAAREAAEAAELAVKEAAEANAARQKEAELVERRKKQAEEDERQERVAESIAIYKAQKEAKEKARAEGKVVRESGEAAPAVNSWDAAVGPMRAVANASAQEQQVVELGENDAPAARNIPTQLYWTENMDIILAKQVQACVFDFDRVSAAMVKQFGNEAVGPEACRLRWADLDAGENANVLETNFTCYVKEDAINAKAGHGGQPTFDALSSMSRGQFPAYLKAPAAFPSTADLSDEDDENVTPIVSAATVPQE